MRQYSECTEALKAAASRVVVIDVAAINVV